MEIWSEGKTKTVWKTAPDLLLLVFKDTVTGIGQTIDPGGNEVVGQIEGKGLASLKMSSYFFKKLAEAGISTHYLESDLKKGTMLVKQAETFGAGLEFICRLQAMGSFVQRYGKYVESGEPLDYLVEITIKDDQQGDPLINEASIVQLNLMTETELRKTVELTKQITYLINKILQTKGLDLIDIKLEFGKIVGQIALIDEISGDNMRVSKEGKILTQKELSSLICG